MQDKIKDKLIRLLEKPTLKEEDVVYFLVQLQKIQERYRVEGRNRPEFTTDWIKLFRGWAVHGKADTTQSEASNEIHAGIAVEYLFNKLLVEIGQFKFAIIPDNLLSSFKESLRGIIEDIPLTVNKPLKNTFELNNQTGSLTLK